MSGEPRFAQVWLDVPSEQADEAAASMFELGAEGVEQRDEGTLGGGPGPGMTTLVASFPDSETAEGAAEELGALGDARVRELLGDAWRDEWKKHFAPFALTERVTVRPPWEAYEPRREGEIVLELEPGRAFGTGLHETTSLVARALEALVDEVRGARVLDVGTGSGILALVAAAYGAAEVRAVDVDPEAVEVARENAQRNGARVEVDATPIESIAGLYDVVLANIEARVLIPMSADLAARVRPGGALILSGILAPQADDVRRAFTAFELADAPAQGEWIALVLRNSF